MPQRLIDSHKLASVIYIPSYSRNPYRYHTHSCAHPRHYRGYLLSRSYERSPPCYSFRWWFSKLRTYVDRGLFRAQSSQTRTDAHGIVSQPDVQFWSPWIHSKNTEFVLSRHEVINIYCVYVKAILKMKIFCGLQVSPCMGPCCVKKGRMDDRPSWF